MKKQALPAIQLTKVKKRYTFHHEKPTFVESMLKRGPQERFLALNNVSATIYKGEKVGIIGANGSGKTTLLKIIAGIATPDSGEVKANGKIVSLIDLEAGFHPDLTGEENIYLNGLIIGMSKADIQRKKKQIIEFADIGHFIDAPLYTYSEGMKLRLGFSVAVHADPDILILDEAMGVGDEEFREKSDQKLLEFFNTDKTILVVSHWLEYLEKNVDRFIWINKGKVKAMGDARILKDYRNFFK